MTTLTQDSLQAAVIAIGVGMFIESRLMLRKRLTKPEANSSRSIRQEWVEAIRHPAYGRRQITFRVAVAIIVTASLLIALVSWVT